ARFTVTRLGGSGSPRRFSAALTRSRDSCTAAPGRPTIVNEGRPPLTMTSTVTRTASTPTTVAEATVAYIGSQARRRGALRGPRGRSVPSGGGQRSPAVPAAGGRSAPPPAEAGHERPPQPAAGGRGGRRRLVSDACESAGTRLAGTRAWRRSRAAEARGSVASRPVNAMSRR